MNPLTPSATAATAAPEAWPRPRKGAGVVDTVMVSDDNFDSVVFMGAVPRREFTRERMATADKPQKRTAAGVPLWSVQVAARNWRKQTDLINVTVPSAGDPSEEFAVGQQVQLIRLVFGVSPRRGEGGYVTWTSADGIKPAGAVA